MSVTRSIRHASEYDLIASILAQNILRATHDYFWTSMSIPIIKNLF